MAPKPNKQSTKELTAHLQHLVCKMQVQKFHFPVCHNVVDALGTWEFDVLSVSKKGLVYEFEVKVSRADFLNDRKKRCRYWNDSGVCPTKHEYYSYKEPHHIKRVPNYYSYVCPKDLIKPVEIGAGTGLYYVNGDDIECVQAPKLLHKHEHDFENISRRCLNLLVERTYLGGARMTVKNRESDATFYKYEIKGLAQALLESHKSLVGLHTQHDLPITDQMQFTEAILRKHNLVDVLKPTHPELGL